MCTLATLSFFRVGVQGGSEEAHVRADIAVVANLDLHRVNNCAVSADKHVVSYSDVISIIASKRSFNNHFCADATHVGDWGSHLG